MDKIDLILHPIRARIISTAAHTPITTQAIAARMPDIPQTTLYRHINLLIENNVLTIVREVKVRGTVERELQLREGGARIAVEELAAVLPEDQLRYFLVFLSVLISDFSRAAADPNRLQMLPIALYFKDSVYATPEEIVTLRSQFDALLDPYRVTDTAEIENQNRRRWSLSGIIMNENDEEKPE